MLISCPFMKTLISQHTLDSSQSSCSPAPLGTWRLAISTIEGSLPSLQNVCLRCTSKIHVKFVELGVGSCPTCLTSGLLTHLDTEWRIQLQVNEKKWESQRSMASKWILYYFNLLKRRLVAVKVAALILIETLGFWPLKWHAFFALCT